MTHLEPSWILPVGLVWFGLYICQINQSCTYNWAKEKNILNRMGTADFLGVRGRCQKYSVASLNMKNLMSPTPRN